MLHIIRVPTQVLKGIIMSYFRFYIYKAIRKVLFLPIFSDLIKVLFLALETSIIRNWLPACFSFI